MPKVHRKTKETDISLNLSLTPNQSARQETGLPFFNHMLHAMAFHGGFFLDLKATGDIDVDPHHLVEDTGIVLGQALEKLREESNGICRFGQGIIPMDDALAEAIIDVCARPYLVFNVQWAQPQAGNFDLSLLREFFLGLSSSARMNLHLSVRYAENGHHAAEALFKACGKALAQAYTPKAGGEKTMSTKGMI